MFSSLWKKLWIGHDVLSIVHDRGFVALCNHSLHEEGANLLLAHVSDAHLPRNRQPSQNEGF